MAQKNSLEIRHHENDGRELQELVRVHHIGAPPKDATVKYKKMINHETNIHKFLFTELTL